jgi:NitT/TauT family transport system ATP-binding protein
MIFVQNLAFTFPNSPMLFADFSWQVQAGESWAIIGPSGCGKTTLLYLLAGLRRPHSGGITIAGQELSRPRPETGLILQDYGLLPWATVTQNIRLGHQIRDFYGPDGLHAPERTTADIVEKTVEQWLSRLRLDSVRHAYPGQLSGGQRQRTAIARTLVLNPDLLLMDEPFASLDAPTRETLQDLVLELHQERSLTTVIVTHTIEEAVVLGKRILVLNEPPNKDTLVIENPGSGIPNYRQQPGYFEVCAQLRETLDTRS